MGTFLLIAMLTGTVIGALNRPSIGVYAYYLFALLVPAALWPWIFKGMRVSFFVAIATILGFFLQVMKKNVNFKILKNKNNIYLFVLWLAVVFSYLLNPYGHSYGELLLERSEYVLSNMTKTILFYYIAICSIDTLNKYRNLLLIFIGTSIFYVYWGNNAYFSGQIMKWGNFGLTGPGTYDASSVYSDENTFASLYVMSIPFLYYYGFYIKNKFAKIFLFINVLLAWHAIFLTGSRGGLLGLLTVTLYMGFGSKYKKLSIFVPIALLLAFYYQGGSYMKYKSTRITSIEDDSSAQGRLLAWGIATTNDF